MAPHGRFNLGQFQPVNKLSGSATSLLPPQPRKRKQASSSPVANPKRRPDPVLASTASAAAAAPSPSPASASSPASDAALTARLHDPYDYPLTPKKRRVSSSNHSGSLSMAHSDNRDSVPELRSMDKIVFLGGKKRHRRPRNAALSPAPAPAPAPAKTHRPLASGLLSISLPQLANPPTGEKGAQAVTVVADSDNEKHSDGNEPVIVAAATRKQPSAQSSNNDNRSNGATPSRKRIRDAMLGPPAQPQQQQNGAGRERTLYGAKLENDSVDELSTEFFADRPAKKKATSKAETGLSGTSRPPPASGAKRQQGLTPILRDIVSRPLCVEAAVCYPCHVFGGEEEAEAAEAGSSTALATDRLFRLTVDGETPGVLCPVDAARAQREKLAWLRVDLRRVHAIKYGGAGDGDGDGSSSDNMSCVVAFDLPQQGQNEDRLGPLLALRFRSRSDAERLVEWSSRSDCVRKPRLISKTGHAMANLFDKAFCEAKAERDKQAVRKATEPEAKPIQPGGPPSYMSPGIRKESIWTVQQRSLLRRSSLSEQAPVVEADPPTTPAAAAPVSASAVTPAWRTAVDVDTYSPATRSSARLLRSSLGRATRSSTGSLASGSSGGGTGPFLAAADSDLAPERWTETHPDWDQAWRMPLTYCRTTLDRDDVARLDEGQFLNDNVINFYMEYQQDSLKKSGSSVASRVYFHNTFFYEKLKPSRGNKISFAGVKRWTAKADLFSYDYIVVPVNEHAHWWLAIICNVPTILALALPAGAETEGGRAGAEAEDTTASAPDSDAVAAEGGRPTGRPTRDHKSAYLTIPIATAGNGARADQHGRGGDEDDVSQVKSDLGRPPPAQTTAAASSPGASSFSGSQARRPAKGGGVFIPSGRKPDPRDGRIFTLDSLGCVHGPSVDHLKQWLLAEIEERKGVKPQNPGRLGTTAKTVPQQENLCDCGVYVLLYLEAFLEDPDSFIEDLVLRQERDWKKSAPDMRKQLRELILHEQQQFQAKQEAQRRAKKKAAASRGAPPKEREASRGAPPKEREAQLTGGSSRIDRDSSRIDRGSSHIDSSDSDSNDSDGIDSSGGNDGSHPSSPLVPLAQPILPSVEVAAVATMHPSSPVPSPPPTPSSSASAAVSPPDPGCNSPFQAPTPDVLPRQQQQQRQQG